MAAPLDTAIALASLLLTPQAGVKPEVELAWHLFEGAEGNGYATEAAQEIRYWAYQSHGLNQLVSYIHHGNRRSQAVAKRLGAETDGSRADHEPDAEIWRHLAVK